VSLLPFVPSGPEYEASRRLFKDLGFEEVWENSGYAGFRNGDAQFILQRYEDRQFAENFMVRLNVPDLDAWWQAIAAKRLEGAYPAFRIKPPADFPLGARGELHRPRRRVLARGDGLTTPWGLTPRPSCWIFPPPWESGRLT
jgi:catechol 2,3-dioxygenase-like lactoylglutathione lyase family enzyme